MSLTGKDLVAFGKKQPVGVTCAALSLMLVGVLYFRSDSLDEQTKVRDDKQAEAKRLKSNIANSKNLQGQLDELAADNKDVQGRAVQPRDASLNLKYFYQLEAAAAVKQISDRHTTSVALPATGKGAPSKAAYTPDGYAIMVQGEFRPAVDFLRRIERGPHFSRFTNVVLAAAARDAELGAKLNLTVNLELLAVPPVPPPTALPAPGNVLPLAKRKATLELAQKLVPLQPPAPLPTNLKDPFNPPGFKDGEPDPALASAATSDPATIVVPPPRPPADRELLEAIAPLITPSGTAVFGGESLLLFGQKRLRIGDTLPIIYKDKPYELTLTAIEGNNFTLRLHDELFTRPIKSSPSSKP